MACNLILLLSAALAADNSAPPVLSFAPTEINSDAHQYATFQSHNQKVVWNQYGIFVSYVASANSDYSKVNWKLIRSIDGGATFSQVYEGTHATHPPAIETDAHGRIYLWHANWTEEGLPSYFYRFDPDKGYLSPLIVRIPDSAAQKFTMLLDRKKGHIYVVATVAGSPPKVTFLQMNLSGKVQQRYQLTKSGRSADAHYLQLALDESGRLWLAWTTSQPREYTYWSIHFAVSLDHGRTWRLPNRTRLPTPFIADETGPTPRITLDDEFDPSTWLGSLTAKNGKLHFFYLARNRGYSERQHYIRYDVATGKVDRNVYPDWGGESHPINSFDGQFVHNLEDPKGPMYCVLRGVDNRVVVLASQDNGASWHDYAVGPEITLPFYPFQIGAARSISGDGSILVTYTEVTGMNPNRYAVKFARIPIHKTPPTVPRKRR